MTLTLVQAEDLAARTLAAIDATEADTRDGVPGALSPLIAKVLRRLADDRERLASDLAGLRDVTDAAADLDQAHADEEDDTRAAVLLSLLMLCRRNAQRFSDGLKRTARPYGKAPDVS